MANALTRIRRSAIACAFTLGAGLALATSVGAAHLPEACRAFVSADGGEPASSATVAIGERLEVHGWFPQGDRQPGSPSGVFVALEKEGVWQRSFTNVATDEHDEILLIIEFDPGDAGRWRITAGGENSGCGGPADVTVVATDATPAPATTLPDAGTRASDTRGSFGLLIALAAITLLFAGRITVSRRRA